MFRELQQKGKSAEAPKRGAPQADQTPAIAAAVAQGNSAFVARLASLEKKLAEVKASSSGAALSAKQASGPAGRSTGERLADIQSALASQQTQLNQLAKVNPSMCSCGGLAALAAGVRKAWLR